MNLYPKSSSCRNTAIAVSFLLCSLWAILPVGADTLDSIHPTAAHQLGVAVKDGILEAENVSWVWQSLLNGLFSPEDVPTTPYGQRVDAITNYLAYITEHLSTNGVVSGWTTQDIARLIGWIDDLEVWSELIYDWLHDDASHGFSGVSNSVINLHNSLFGSSGDFNLADSFDGIAAHNTAIETAWSDLLDNYLGSADNATSIIGLLNTLNGYIQALGEQNETWWHEWQRTTNVSPRLQLAWTTNDVQWLLNTTHDTYTNQWEYFDFIRGAWTNQLRRWEANHTNLLSSQLGASTNFFRGNLSRLDAITNYLERISATTNVVSSLTSNDLDRLVDVMTNAFYIRTIPIWDLLTDTEYTSPYSEDYMTLAEFLGFYASREFTDETPWRGLFGQSYMENVNYRVPTNGLSLLMGDYNGKTWQLSTLQPYIDQPDEAEDWGLYPVRNYDTWLLACMRDSLALLSYGVLDDITNSWAFADTNELSDAENGNWEMPRSEKLDAMRDTVQQEFDSASSRSTNSISALGAQLSGDGDSTLYIDFQSVFPDMSAISFEAVDREVAASARAMFVWLWRFILAMGIFKLVRHEYDYWMSIGRHRLPGMEYL